MIRLAARDGAGLGIDPGRIAVGGDSAGANLALAAAVALRDDRLRGVVSALDLRRLFDRHREPVLAALWPRRGPVADADALDLGDLSRTAGAAKDWRAAPMLAELEGLPPARLIVGSLDLLLDDSQGWGALHPPGSPTR